MSKIFYKGFSSSVYENNKSFKLIDLELVKTDLLNHIWTRPGDRVGMPTWGTRIPDLPFEPLDQELLDIIKEDLTMVFNADPRVKLLDIKLFALPNNNAVAAISTLQYLELNIVDDLRIDVKVASQ